MSAFAAVLGGRSDDGARLTRAMLRTMAHRGDAREARVWFGGSSAIGVSRLAWELGADLSGDVHVLVDADVIVAADATLCYRDDLRRRLAGRGVTPTGDTPSHLVLAAYRAWGTECPRELEGEFAFVLWDASRRRALCARDFLGRRPLFYAEIEGSLVVASAVRAFLAHPACPRDLNITSIGSTAAGLLWSAGSDTAYRAINVLRAAGTLAWSEGSPLGRPMRHWTTPDSSSGRVTQLDEAAEELRGLLRRAVSERLASSGTTTVWMSGGWDSTSVFGAGKSLLRDEPGNRALVPVSISYPEGDPGREDELISQVADFWASPVHWLHIDSIPLLDGLESRAAASDEPPAHLYESWNRALARGSRACDSRIVFDGCGGDHLFQVSDIYLADLLRRGQIRRLAREVSFKRARGARYLLQTAVEPLLAPGLSRFARRLMGSAPRGHYLDRPLPAWIRPDFANRHGLVERDRSFLPARDARSLADAESRCYITAPAFAFGASYMSGALLEEGVEVRSPLLDRRIVEFALRRPVEERASGAETKVVLRRAARGVVPDAVLAPRPRRTGLTSAYSSREMRQHFPTLFRSLFQSDILLAELGIVEPDVLRRSVEQYLAHGGDWLRVALFHSLKTELWLRGPSRDRALGASAVIGDRSRTADSSASPVPRHEAVDCAGQTPVLH